MNTNKELFLEEAARGCSQKPSLSELVPETSAGTIEGSVKDRQRVWVLLSAAVPATDSSGCPWNWTWTLRKVGPWRFVTWVWFQICRACGLLNPICLDPYRNLWTLCTLVCVGQGWELTRAGKPLSNSPVEARVWWSSCPGGKSTDSGIWQADKGNLGQHTEFGGKAGKRHKQKAVFLLFHHSTISVSTQLPFMCEMAHSKTTTLEHFLGPHPQLRSV